MKLYTTEVHVRTICVATDIWDLVSSESRTTVITAVSTKHKENDSVFYFDFALNYPRACTRAHEAAGGRTGVRQEETKGVTPCASCSIHIGLQHRKMLSIHVRPMLLESAKGRNLGQIHVFLARAQISSGIYLAVHTRRQPIQAMLTFSGGIFSAAHT